MAEIITVLGIETSCDDTSVAIVDSRKNILRNQVFAELAEHIYFGGVVPEIASRNHLLKLPEMAAAARDEIAKVDAIAVTAGPGLIGGLIVGVMYAKALAYSYNKPLIAINHLEGHLLTPVLCDDEVSFPFLALLISGGHCQFVLAESLGKYKVIGQTLDDSIGEAFDKVGKMMGLDYPAGPKIEQLAKNGDAKRFNFPRPLLHEKNCNFSLSGLKTAVSRQLAKLKQEAGEELPVATMSDIAASFQAAVIDVICKKTENAISIINQYNSNENQASSPQVKSLCVCGGVAANQAIKAALSVLAERHRMSLHTPPVKLCTDNAAMIAWAGIMRMEAGLVVRDKDFQNSNDMTAADYLTTIKPRSTWDLEELSKKH